MSKPPKLKRILAEARVCLIAAAVPLLMRLKLAQLERVLEVGTRRPSSPITAAAAADLAARVDATLRRGWLFVRPGCLPRGVTLYYLLRKRGLDVSLCFGMGKPAGDLEGHCWLELDGQPFLERTDPRPHFNEIVRMPGIGNAGSSRRAVSGFSRG